MLPPITVHPVYDILWGCMSLLIAIKTSILVYRLCFHPLSSVPGPRLAAATSLYIRYHDIIEHGGLAKRLPQLHKFYKSNVIRIAPNHVHIDDPSIHKSVLTSKPVFEKCGDFYPSAQGVHTILTEVDPRHHRALRNTALPLFSTREMDRSFLTAQTQIHRAAASMMQNSQAGPVDLWCYFQATLSNITAETLLGLEELVCYDAPKSGWMATHHFLDRYRWLIADVPWVVPLGLKLVESCPRLISWISVGFRKVYGHCRAIGDELLLSRSAENNARSAPNHQTVLHLEDETPRALSNSDVFALFQQAAAFLLAGTTPAITLVVACFYIVKSPSIQDRLQKELDELDRRTPGGVSSPQADWRELTRLKYLDAVVKESLRILAPVPGLLPRVVPRDGMQIGSHLLPAGTRISAALSVLHHNETVFPNPHTFQPERWLQSSPAELQTMEQYFMPFSKGPRACIGSRQAYMYMFTFLAHLWTNFEITAVGKLPESLDWKEESVAAPVNPPLVWLRPRTSVGSGCADYTGGLEGSS